jgi:hypothetical protein
MSQLTEQPSPITIAAILAAVAFGSLCLFDLRRANAAFHASGSNTDCKTDLEATARWLASVAPLADRDAEHLFEQNFSHVTKLRMDLHGRHQWAAVAVDQHGAIGTFSYCQAPELVEHRQRSFKPDQHVRVWHSLVACHALADFVEELVQLSRW